MNEFNPNRNLCMVAAIVTPMTAEQQEWIRLGGNDAGKVCEDATGIDLLDPDNEGASTPARKSFNMSAKRIVGGGSTSSTSSSE